MSAHLVCRAYRLNDQFSPHTQRVQLKQYMWNIHDSDHAARAMMIPWRARREQVH
jgi:hypothetical protein